MKSSWACFSVAWLLASSARHVYSVDIIPEFITSAQTKLNSLSLGSKVTLEVGDASSGWDHYGPYDVIAITGSLVKVPDSLRRSLKIGGRMFCIEGELPAMTAKLVTRTGDQSIGPGDTDRNAENEGVAEDARDLCPGGCERRLAHPQRLEDLLMHVCLEVDTRDLFDEPRKDPIVGVRVGPIGARCEGQSATSQVGSCFTWRPWPFDDPANVSRKATRRGTVSTETP